MRSLVILLALTVPCAAADKWYGFSATGARCEATDPYAAEAQLKAMGEWEQTVELKSPSNVVLDLIIVTKTHAGTFFFKDSVVCEYARREAWARGIMHPYY